MASSGNNKSPHSCTIKRIYTKISHESIRRVGSPERGVSNMAADDRPRYWSRTSSPSQNITQVDTSERLFHRSDSIPQVANRLIEMLDHVEKRVEMLREHATAMEQERDFLLSMINKIQTNEDLTLISEGEREEIQVTAERLRGRTITVEVSVTTPRNQVQEKALNQVNHYIDDLVEKITSDLDGAKRACQEYLNACLPESRGPVDQKFQAAIIECTADDQKKARKRLESLLSTIIHAEGSLYH